MHEVMAPDQTFTVDLENIEQIPVISTLLNVVCRTTGMGFAAVARVTEDKWLACSVRDKIGFGLKPGDELEIKTTICNEIRQHNKPVIIDDVAEDPCFREHPTPAMYGFKSYISVPIIKKDGSFFGTLCAIDPSPKRLSSPEVSGMFTLFADLISFHLHALEQVQSTEKKLAEERRGYKKSEEFHKIFTDELEKKVQERTQQLKEKNEALEKMNTELQSFTYVASHDLQEPLRKIRLFANAIHERELTNLSDRGKKDFDRIQNAAERMQTLIRDLMSYPQTVTDKKAFAVTDLNKIIALVKSNLTEELQQKNATIEVDDLCEVNVIAFQIRQVFHNLISNSLKFCKSDGPVKIKISSKTTTGAEFNNQHLDDNTVYCHLQYNDNGIGFDEQYNEKVFKLFQRLHARDQYDGTGIGLAIVKKIVENHDGIITATGKLNEGVQFDIYIPV